MEARSIIGGFNSIFYLNKRVGDNLVQEREVADFRDFLFQNELTEMRSYGAFFTWTNRSITSKLDRGLINIHWHSMFDFMQLEYLVLGLYDDTPMLLLNFSHCLRATGSFKYCARWCLDLHFNDSFKEAMSNAKPGCCMCTFIEMLKFLK